MIDATRIGPVVTARLAVMRAASTSDLVEGAPRRALGHGAFSMSPYGQGQAGWVAIVLAADTLKIPTEIGLRFTIGVDTSGATVITDSPDRADLVAATRMALDGERRAYEVATKALDAAGIEPTTTWSATLRVMRLDPRLPAATFVGQPSWQVMFDPFDEARGGYHHVLISLPGWSTSHVR